MLRHVLAATKRCVVLGKVQRPCLNLPLPSIACKPVPFRPPFSPPLVPQLRLDKALRLGPYLGLYLRGRAGAVLGDLPPYEAFPIGGTNSVRGYAGAAARGRGEGTGAADSKLRHIAKASCTPLLDLPPAGRNTHASICPSDCCIAHKGGGGFGDMRFSLLSLSLGLWNHPVS